MTTAPIRVLGLVAIALGSLLSPGLAQTPPPLPVDVPWTLIARGQYNCAANASPPCSTVRWSPSWSKVHFNEATNELHFYPGAPGNPAGGLFASFSFATNRWTAVQTPGIAPGRHNGTLFLDVSAGVAYAGGFAPDGGQPHTLRIDLATKRMAYVTNAPWPGSGSVLVVKDTRRNRVVSLGGWSTGVTFRVQETDATPPWSWTTVAKATGPVLYSTPGNPKDNEFGRTSSQRGDYDPTSGTVWFVDANQDLWIYDVATQQMTKPPVTGPKPPPATLYTFHEAAQTWVGWTEGPTGCATPCGVTWLLRRGTSQWVAGAPPTKPYTQGFNTPSLTYNRTTKCVALLTGWSYQADVWTYCLPDIGMVLPSPMPPATLALVIDAPADGSWRSLA